MILKGNKCDENLKPDVTNPTEFLHKILEIIPKTNKLTKYSQKIL